MLQILDLVLNKLQRFNSDLGKCICSRFHRKLLATKVSFANVLHYDRICVPLLFPRSYNAKLLGDASREANKLLYNFRKLQLAKRLPSRQ